MVKLFSHVGELVLLGVPFHSAGWKRTERKFLVKAAALKFTFQPYLDGVEVAQRAAVDVGPRVVVTACYAWGYDDRLKLGVDGAKAEGQRKPRRVASLDALPGTHTGGATVGLSGRGAPGFRWLHNHSVVRRG